MDAGYRVHLAHPSAIKKYEGLKYSGDFADARYLGHLLRLGLLAEGYIYPREQRGARELARKRLERVEELAFIPDVALAVEANGAVPSAGQQIEALEKRVKERLRAAELQKLEELGV
jgi:transposase